MWFGLLFLALIYYSDKLQDKIYFKLFLIKKITIDSLHTTKKLGVKQNIATILIYAN